MVSAVDSSVLSSQMSRLSLERDQGSAAPGIPAGLVAALRINTDPAQNLLVNPPDISALSVGDGNGDGIPFILAEDVCQRDDGLVAAIVGEAVMQVDSERKPVDAAALLALYDAEGKASLAKLLGSWALVIMDPQQSRLLLACDRMGRQPLYYCSDNGSVLIGDSLQSFSGQEGLDSQALYHYLYFHMVPAPQAVRNGFRKLGMATVLELTPTEQTLTRYWTPIFNEKPIGSLSAAHDELRQRLKTAVARCTSDELRGQRNAAQETQPGTPKVAAFLSGGLDSSTVAGMLSEIQGGSAEAYAIGFNAEGYDEMPYARLAAKHFGIHLNEWYVTPEDVVQALPDIASATDEPFGNSSVLPAYFCARMAAKDGVDILLAGDGGDELFAGNERYLSQRVFENYRCLPRWLRGGLIEPLVNSLPKQLPLVPKAHSFLRQANTLLPERLQYYSFLEQNNPAEVFSAAFLQQVDQSRPLQVLEAVYQSPEQATTLNRMLYLDWQNTLADNDLRKVSQACSLAGVTVRYPMLDDELTEFSTRLPSAWKLPGKGTNSRKLRYFYKQGLKGWLPDETISKSKQGFGLPFGVWMKTHKPLQEMAYDNVLRMKTRGIFRPEFLDQAITNHRDGHAAYYGELIWLLMYLELWMAANEPSYRLE